MKNIFLRLVPIVTLAMAGCAVGPNYGRPMTATPEHYKAEALGSWKQGQPVDSVPKGDWWKVFGDKTLNDLQSRAAGANQEFPSLPIFAGGGNLANYRPSEAAFQETFARYRQSIVVAFGYVENSTAGIRFLADEAAAQDREVANSSRAAELAGEHYRAGIVSYLEVVDADRVALQAERASAQLAGQRLIASVHLITALGGGWYAQGFSPTTSQGHSL